MRQYRKTLCVGVSSSDRDIAFLRPFDSDVTSPESLLTISVYDRSKAGEGFLGVKEIKPVLKDGVTVDNWFSCVSKCLGQYGFVLTADLRIPSQAVTTRRGARDRRNLVADQL